MASTPTITFSVTTSLDEAAVRNVCGRNTPNKHEEDGPQVERAVLVATPLAAASSTRVWT